MRDYVLERLCEIAADYMPIRMILFGSRSRYEESKTSDYDIAVFKDDLSETDKAVLFDKIQEIETLKKIDLVFIDNRTDKTLLENIRRDGVIIYDQSE